MPKPLLEAKNIYKTFGKQVVLNNLSFQVSNGNKIALIGRNGAGKSTLLKILLNQIEQDDGQVNTFAWTRIGVIHQNEVLPNDKTALKYLEDVSGKPYWEVQKLGSKFGLHAEHLEKAPSQLSGGYQMRIKLVARFLQDPNLLFLDEPVNYLDLQTILLLENVLAQYRGSFILIAHDRTFLQNTCEIVYEIEREELTIYDGKVEEFLEWKAEQVEFSRKTNKKLLKEMKRHQQFVDRFRYKANLATRAQSKIKHISKLRSKITKINADLSTTRITIATKPTHADVVLRVEDLAICYGKNIITKDITLSINRGEKIVIVGENGRGKSTLLKNLVGNIKPLEGAVKWWKHASVGYYDQLTSESLNENETVLEHLTNNAPGSISAEQILMMAGNFLFRGDDLDKKVSMLSGGERARLALAGILLKMHNVLVLDEPTNHLDVETSDCLSLALKDYGGAVIFVSHSRTFVSALVDRILEVRDGIVKEYLGNYDEYIEDLAIQMEDDSKDLEFSGSTINDLKTDTHNKRQEIYTRIKKLQKSIKRLDANIESLESEKSEILKFFFENPTDYSPPRAKRLDEVTEELARIEKDWIKNSEEIEKLRKN